MTPAEQIRAIRARMIEMAPTGILIQELVAMLDEATVALDALEADRAETERANVTCNEILDACQAELTRLQLVHAEVVKMRDEWHQTACENLARAELAEAACRREHADRVWLTRDEAKTMRRQLNGGLTHDAIALLDERIGDKS